MKLKYWVPYVLVLGLAGSLHASADDMNPPAIHPVTEGSLTYVSGGFGEFERNALAAVARDYNLKLVFAEKGSGAFMADVKVTIADGKGRKVLETTSQGPWFMVKLPVGRYKVTADSDGRELVQTARVSRGQHTLHFYWPAKQQP